MIFVRPIESPEGFGRWSERWTQNLVRKIENGQSFSINDHWKNRRERIRPFAEILKSAFHHKCAFCESKIEHSAKLHVEHYRPKSNAEFMLLTYQWDNWLIACPECNRLKLTSFSDCEGQPCIINPTSEEPSEHLHFIEWQLFSHSIRGAETIAYVQLNRPLLEEDRSRHLTNIEGWLILFLRGDDAREIAKNLLLASMQENGEYSAMVRAHISNLWRTSPQGHRLAELFEPHPSVNFADVWHELELFLRQELG